MNLIGSFFYFKKLVGYLFVLKIFDDFWDFAVDEQLAVLQDQESDRFAFLLAHCTTVNAHSFAMHVFLVLCFSPVLLAFFLTF